MSSANLQSTLRSLLVLPFVLLLSGCPPETLPSAPVLVNAVTNSALTPATASAPALVVISSTPWQNTSPRFGQTFTWGWLEDTLVGNPYSFQLQINVNLLNARFSLQDASGAELASVANRSNTSHLCSAANGQAIPSSECYWHPGNFAYIMPPPVPTASTVYSFGLVNTCADTITPLHTSFDFDDRAPHCTSGQADGATTLLTISPARPLQPGVNVRFKLVATNATGSTSTPFDVMLPLPPPPQFQQLPHVFGGIGSSSSGGTNMPPPTTSKCSETEFSFQMTCTQGGAKFTTTYAGTGCTHEEAREQLSKIYSTELKTQNCVLSQ